MGKEVLISGEPFKRALEGSFQVTTTATNQEPAPLSRGIEIVAYETNTEPIYLSHRHGVTADATPDGGFRLIPGASIFMPALDMKDVWFITPTGPQFLTFLAY